LAAVRQLQPRLTVAPDIEKGRSLQEVTAMADQLQEHADAVVVVPKDVHPTDVPDRFRVGMTLAPNFGSTAPWSVWDYRDTGLVHLLGGGPARQLVAKNHLPVTSLDTAALGKQARFGYWDGVSKDAPDDWDYRRRLAESLRNYAAVWQRQ